MQHEITTFIHCLIGYNSGTCITAVDALSYFHRSCFNHRLLFEPARMEAITMSEKTVTLSAEEIEQINKRIQEDLNKESEQNDQPLAAEPQETC